jgi:hypothetical protein
MLAHDPELTNNGDSSEHAAIKIPLHRRYARFFDKVGWFWEYKPTRFRVKLPPDFLVEFVCHRNDCTPTHALLVYIDDKTTDPRERMWKISKIVNRSPYDVPNIAVFGEAPQNSHWEMVHGDGGGCYTVDDWINCDIDNAWAATA